MTTTYVASNNGNTTLAANLGAGGTSITVYTGQGTRLPTINNGGGAAVSEYTKVTLQKADGTKEIVNLVRHDAGADVANIGVPGTNTADVAGRAQEGTTAGSFVIGDVVACRPTASLMEAAVNAPTALAAAAAAAAAQAVADAALPKAGGTMTGDLTIGAGRKVIFEGATDDAFKTTLVCVDPTADRVITMPDETMTLAGRDVAQAFTKGQRGAIVALADSATIALDLSLANNYAVQLGGNRTLGAPTNIVAGQSGSITVLQDKTGSRTLAYEWPYVWAGGTAGTLSTPGGTEDQLVYEVRSYNSAAATITIATPGVVTMAAHGFYHGQRAILATTGALPTGLNNVTVYFVEVIDANSFYLCTSLANVAAGTRIATSGSQSGVHTLTGATIRLALNKAYA